MFVLIDLPAVSGAAETYTAEEHKMAVLPLSPSQQMQRMCCTRRRNHLFKRYGIQTQLQNF
jgi:hypothetical protein